jgi:hypothetical protein
MLQQSSKGCGNALLFFAQADVASEKSECKSCSDKANLAHDGLQSSCVIATSVSCLGENST